MKKIILQQIENETKLALLENNKLVEVIVENKNHVSKVGNIYLAKVTENAKNFVFLDIGTEKVFLNAIEGIKFKVGEQILVQVRKDAFENKLAAVSVNLNFVSDLLILSKSLLPSEHRGFVSSKIEETQRREQLKNWANENAPPGYGIVIRTSAKEVKEEVLQKELQTLRDRAESILNKNQEEIGLRHKEGESVYYEPALKLLLTSDVDEIVCSHQSVKEEIESLSLAQQISIGKEADLFTYYEITHQIEELNRNKVWLKTGGYLLIEKTAALCVIDVNSGKSFNKKKDVIEKVNKEAAIEIARQIRLRNIAGMIIVDFINQNHEGDSYKELLEVFGEVLKKDRQPINLLGMTKLGLCELTRKRGRGSYVM